MEANLGLGELPRLPFPPPTVPPWEEEGDWVVSLRLQGGSRRLDPPERVLEDALATVRAYDRLQSVFYTDGSVEGGVEHGGSAVVEVEGDPGHPIFLDEWSQRGPKFLLSFETGVCSPDVCQPDQRVAGSK